MANLAETATYDAGVYQIELTDPVIGGPSGISNAPLKNLANRTAYLKEAVDNASADLSSHLASATPHAAASTTVSGIVELATNAETQTGTDSTRAVTPASLASKVASESAAGIVELATSAEVQAGTDSTRAVTPAGLAARTATESRAGVVELATIAEVQAGTDATRAVTPAGLNGFFVGAVQMVAMSTAPTGWLKCNGALLSRTTYAALFAAIGTTFGVGDGSTTFALPDLRGEFLRCWDDGAGIDSGRAFGSAQSGQNEAHTHVGSGSGVWVDAPGLYVANSGGSVVNLNRGTLSSQGGTEVRVRNIALLACIKY